MNQIRQAPCMHCGYNGPGFHQPKTHPCAGKTDAELFLDYKSQITHLETLLGDIKDLFGEVNDIIKFDSEGEFETEWDERMHKAIQAAATELEKDDG